MAYQLSDIRTKVLLRVDDSGFPTSTVTNFINDTINDVYNEYRLPFMQTTQNYTTTINVSDVTNGTGLPANLVNIIDVIVTTNGQEQLLPYEEIDTLDGSYPDLDDTSRNAAGYPRYWYRYGSFLKVFPVPSVAYTVTVRYYKRPTALAADGDVPELPQEFEELIVTGASYRVMQVRDNYDQAGVLQNKYDELLDKLVMRYSSPQVGRPTIMGINRRRNMSRSIDSYRRI